MRIGYARVSTADQNPELQEDALQWDRLNSRHPAPFGAVRCGGARAEFLRHAQRFLVYIRLPYCLGPIQAAGVYIRPSNFTGQPQAQQSPRQLANCGTRGQELEIHCRLGTEDL
jgi:hypothetical protein